MPDFKEFRRRATFYVTLAGEISDPGYKAVLLDLAERWRQLASAIGDEQPGAPAESDE